MSQRKSSNPIVAIILLIVIAGAGYSVVKKIVAKPSVSLEDAVSDGNITALNGWINYGVDLEQRTLAGGQYTPLYLAAQDDMRQVAHILLEKGAKPNTTDSLGNTPLMEAASAMDIDLMKDLLDHGADPNMVSKAGDTALMAAARASLAPTETVAKNAPANTKGRILLAAANATAARRAEVIKVLLDRKADPNLGNIKGVPTIFRLTDSMTAEDLMFDSGLKPDIKTADGKTLLFTVCLSKTAAEKLIAAGLDVNAKDKAGETPLMYGTDPGVTEVLIAHGADVNASDAQNLTPLYHMALSSVLPIDKMEVLLQHGAKIDVTSAAGESLMHYAAVRNNKALTDLLVKHGGVPVVLPPKGPKKPPKGGGD